MSKKQVKTKKNVFGLVSKIGSLIKKGNSASNIESVETARSSGTSGSETPRRNFNIQISDDNQEIFAVGDDEEEEEEDEEENEKEIKDKKEKESKDNKNENIISDDKDKKIDKEIKNENINPDIKNEAKENENKNKDISAKEEEKQKQNIKNSNLNDNNSINNVKNETKVNKDNTNIDDKEVKKIDENNSNSKIIEEKNKKENINEIKEENNINNDNNIKEENIINDNNKINNEENIENSIKENTLKEYFETCHLCLKKGNDFNSDEIYCIPIIRNKKKKSVLQKFGLFKKPKYDLVNYKIFFDECFIYLSKDIVIDKKNINKRRINNVLKIKNIINFNTKKEQNNYFVTIDIYNKNGVLKNKEFFIEEKYFEYFNREINKSLELYGGLYMKSKKL